MKYSLLSLLVFLVTTQSDAASAVGKKYRVPYGMAGCGVGTFVTQENSKLNQLAVWVIDYFVFGRCFGHTSSMSSQTSNCTERPEEISSVEKEVFLAANLSELSREGAQGGGETLDAFGQILGCEDSVELGLITQEHYSTIFTSSDSQTVLHNFLDVLRKQRLDCPGIG